MQIPLLRSLSGRIILGFTVVVLTFAGVSGLINYYMGVLSREIRLIRTTYLPLAMETKNLSEKQQALWEYLSDDLVNAGSRRHAEQLTIKYKAARLKLLRDTEGILENLNDVPGRHRRFLRPTVTRIRQIRVLVDAQEPLYKTLLEEPPLASLRDTAQPADSAPPRQRPVNWVAYRKAVEALDLLRANEADIRVKAQTLAKEQREKAERTALTLERNERRLRMFSIYLGLTAIVVGLLMTVWATITLRPLRRLRDAAKRIAAGDYGSRIGEAGPVEVADLAKEFNTMGVAIEERERELVRSEKLVTAGKMAAMITHEVRNPLSAIGLNTELLEEELAALPEDAVAEARSLCRAITTEVDRLTAITEEYLQFARLPKPKLQLEYVNPIAKNLADFERETLSLRGVELTCELADDLPPVQVDDQQLRQALLNLIRNAADAVIESSGGGRVTLSSRLRAAEELTGASAGHGDGAGSADRGDRDGHGDGAPAFVEVWVSDDGPGIGEEASSKLFEPFFSTKESGTGLGLALTHQIIREHGGNIRVDSSPGRGATFVVSLPAARTRATPDA